VGSILPELAGRENGNQPKESGKPLVKGTIGEEGLGSVGGASGGSEEGKRPNVLKSKFIRRESK